MGADAEAGDAAREAPSSAAVAPLAGSERAGALSPRGSYKRRYKGRLLDPRIGDAVEVAWRGKFRLESLEIYRGTAWWVAIVVDKVSLDSATDPTRVGGPPRASLRPDPRRVYAAANCWYKVTFPGWEGRWDEWVSRDRLRWAARGADADVQIAVHDDVEVWCGSKNVPGAWLEATVQRAKDQEFFMIGRVLSSGSLWVDRSRVRPARRKACRPVERRRSCVAYAANLLPTGRVARFLGGLFRRRRRSPPPAAPALR